MSDLAMQIRLLDEPKGYQWKRLKEIIDDGQAASLGARTFEFHTYGDGCLFQAECDQFRLKYEVSVEGED
ncbi:hypothetical protein [Photobacterium sp. 1_MG-2023]|uniref:hypothetical protein n=1 Tax=Photobacterium sp. 1_MG-2023 TaxID=3062646 RepID=UPI0026E28368|nr:hypothetical protein [Photobacterium sp. 1_MG-2023]MDO6706156.1 hypothetical protein [Photobacterium sp. 1_MG-2023]